MASPLQIVNSGRRPVVVYAPRGRGASGRGTSVRPRTGPQRGGGQLPPRVAAAAAVRRRGEPAPASPWAGFAERITATKAAQEKKQQEQPEPEREGFWGSGFGKGLGFVINNPVTKAVSMPINYIQTGGRAVTLGVEQALKAIHAAPEPVQAVASQIPFLGQLAQASDPERMAADKRSNWEKVFKPNTDYGGGQLLRTPKDPSRMEAFMAGAYGMGLDVAFDPFTYIGGGATRAVSGLSKVDELARARRALELVEESGKAKPDDLARMTQRVANLEDAVKNPTPFTEPTFEVPAPRTRGERIGLIAEQSMTPEGNKLLEQFPTELQQAGLRGFQTAPAELREALGISGPGLRLRGFDTVIPGTKAISRKLNTAGGKVRAGIAAIPGGESKWRNVRTPKGLEESYGVLSRGKSGDVRLAATDIGVRNEIRKGTGEFVARQNRTLSQWSKENLKGKSETERRAMMQAAEVDPEMGPINQLFKSIIESYAKVTGRELDSEFLRNPATYVPHKLNAKFRRVLASAAERNDKAALDFVNPDRTGFYKDDLLEGSGFLERSRKLQPIVNDDGSITPLELDIGGHKVTIDDGTIDGLNNNKSLRAAFPGYEGKFFDDDPVEIARAYIGSTGRQAGRDKAVEALLASGTPLVQRMEGSLEETRQAINEALSLRNEGALLSTVEGGYVPGEAVPDIPEQQIVPGSAADRARRKAVDDLLTEAQAARSPEEAAAAAGEAAVLPKPSPLGETAAKYFRPEGELGTEATKARVQQAKGAGATYAKAALKDVKATEQPIFESLRDMAQRMLGGLRGSIKEQDTAIKAINARIRKMGASISKFGTKVTSENADEIETLIYDVEGAINDMDAQIRRRAGSWKGRTTKANLKIDRELKASLASLKQMRDDVRELVKGAPAEMRTELETRTQALNQNVSEALDDLLAAEMRVEVPETQAALQAAKETIEGQLGYESSEVLRGRYQGIMEDIRTGAQDIINAGVDDTAAMAHERQVYGQILEEIKEIGSRRKRGRLTKADQALMDEAVAKREMLFRTLGATETVGGVAAKMSPFDEAMNELADLRQAIKTATPDEVGALRARSAQLSRQFRSGGRFAEEQRARDVLKNMDAYEAEVFKRTERERAALKAAEYERKARQESLIWANTAKTKQWVGEEAGWNVGESRIPQAIVPGEEGVLPSERYQHTAEVPRTGTEVVRPRTEQEALTSLKNIIEHGTTQEQGARAQLSRLEPQVVEEEATLPARIATGQEEVALKNAAKAEEELGPMTQKSQTWTKLAEDLHDKNKLVVKRDEARVQRDKLNRIKQRGERSDLSATIDDLEGLVKANPLMDDEKITQAESVLHTHRETLSRTDDTKFRAAELNKARKDAYDGKLGKVMIAALNDEWRALRNTTGPIGADDVIMDAELYKRFTNLFELSKEPQLLGRTFNAFTDLFKTYATLSPGFHVRNTIGGIFMNTSDGVSLAHQLEGVRAWRKFMRGGEEWLATQPARIQDAIAAATASGAGGRFEDIGVLAQRNSKLYNKLSSNPVTRFSQRRGTNVEGSMRMGMALHSIDRGESVGDALGRITRVHFDYSQVSQADESMRRIIPFWTFMSRNLPLQIQQQWTNPRLYSYYNNLINNFSLPDEPFTPEYWTRQGAWRTPLSVGGNSIYAQPDLGFTRVGQDIELLGGVGEGEFGKALAQANPLLGASIDFATKRDSFYDRNFEDTDFTERGGLVGKPISMLAKALSQTNEAGQVSDNFWNYVTSLAPPLNQIDRLLPGLTGGQSGTGTWSKRARYLGAPIQTLTPEVQESEYWNQYYAMLDEEDRLRAMLQEAAG